MSAESTQKTEKARTLTSVFDLVSHDERLVYCSWCGAEPGDLCSEWDKPIDTFHSQRLAHLMDLRVTLVAPALKDAGAWVSQQRRGTANRKYANAELFGQAIWARGADIEWRAERDAKRLRLNPLSRPGQTTSAERPGGGV